MAQLTKQRRGELLRAVFEVLAQHPDGIAAKDALAGAEQRLTLTDYERAYYDSGARRFDKVVRFQTLNAVKAGWMTKVKGTWTATDEGIAALAAYPDPLTFMDQAESGYAAWAKQRPADPDLGSDGGDDEADQGTVVTLEVAEETAFGQIRAHLAEMSPYDFQELVAALLRAMGYHVPWVAPRGKDGGVDILAFPDPLGTENPRIKVQVKREQSKTDVQGLRAFMSLLGPGDVGVFVTLGGFTRDAEWEARAENRRVTLIDQGMLVDLWVEHYGKIEPQDRLRLPLKPICYLTTAEPD
jgi:restriction system protein